MMLMMLMMMIMMILLMMCKINTNYDACW